VQQLTTTVANGMAMSQTVTTNGQWSYYLHALHKISTDTERRIDPPQQLSHMFI